MGFGAVFRESLKDYKHNFWSIVKILLVFIVIPVLVYLIVSSVLSNATSFGELLSQKQALQMLATQTYQSILSGGNVTEEQVGALSSIDRQLSDINIQLLPYTLLMLGLSIILLLIGLFGIAGLLSASAMNKKFSFKESVKMGKNLYWKYIGLFLLLGVMYFLIFILVSLIYLMAFSGALQSAVGSPLHRDYLSLFGYLAGYLVVVVAALAPLFIYFQFSPYALAEEKKVFSAMGKSWRSVSRKWWKMFGITILYFIILFGLYIILFFIQYIILGMPSSFAGFIEASQNNQNGIYIVNLIWEIIYVFAVVPISILFFKNLYFSIKSRKR